MTKKIKIIELFQKYANNEELPKKIEYDNTIFELYEGIYTVNENCVDRLADHIYSDFSNLNDYVEVLEDNTEEIEELDEEWTYIEEQVEKTWSKSELALVNKTNELIKAVNSIRKDKSND